MSVSVTTVPPVWKAGSCLEDKSTLGESKPMDHTTLAFSASLGSALSEMMALKAYSPRLPSSSSHFLYASTKLLLPRWRPSGTP